MIEVLITDEKSGGYDNNHRYFNTIHHWAKEHCASYVDMHVQDVSDVSYQWDEIAAYKFTDEKDVVIFKLKWE